jgi:hypothetical protein
MQTRLRATRRRVQLSLVQQALARARLRWRWGWWRLRWGWGVVQQVGVVQHMSVTLQLVLWIQTPTHTRLRYLLLPYTRYITMTTCEGQVVVHVRQVVMAAGHSARELFESLAAQPATARALRAAPFAVGFRIEHPQVTPKP